MSAPVPSWRPDPLPREPWVLLRLLAAAVAGVTRAALRRLVRGPRHAGWSVGLELAAELQRATWALMPVVGFVRWRRAFDMLVGRSAPGVAREDVDAGGVPAEWLVPPDESGPVLLYVHGGGFVFGSPGTHRSLTARLARAACARTLAIDYRLAPEHPSPAALEDTCAAYRFLLDAGVAPERVVVAGDSAGGNLALAGLVALRERGAPLPAGAVLICPWADLACSGESFRTNGPYDFVSAEIGRLAAADYLNGGDPRSPAVSPLFADLSGLPPLLVQAGGAETLRDQVCALAERARGAGVDVQLHVYDAMIHDWHLLPFLPEAEQAVHEIAEFARVVAARPAG